MNDPQPDPSPVASHLASLEGDWRFRFQRSDDGVIALCVGYADEPCLVAHYLASDDVRLLHAQLTAILDEEEDKNVDAFEAEHLEARLTAETEAMMPDMDTLAAVVKQCPPDYDAWTDAGSKDAPCSSI